jgi:hypothetical protein
MDILHGRRAPGTASLDGSIRFFLRLGTEFDSGCRVAIAMQGLSFFGADPTGVGDSSINRGAQN